jgi:hypothetical protein
MKAGWKPKLKDFLGELPLTAETYWLLRQQGQPVGGLKFKELADWLPEFRQAVLESPYRHQPGARITLFATLGYWIQHTTLLGLALAALGHDITLAYLPYANWRKPTRRFDLRLQNLYVQQSLAEASPAIKTTSWFANGGVAALLPDPLQKAVDLVSCYDVMYTEQVEKIEPEAPLLSLRRKRNRQAAQHALASFQSQRPDLVIIPNGSILEFGAVYQVARYLQIPVITYEFGEQRERIWFARNDEVMRQNTDSLWEQFREQPLTPDEWRQIKELFASRQKASLWENFSRRWQAVPSQGGAQVRQNLGLDQRPVVLLPANVIGDSLTLGRQVFSENMTEWLERSVAYFSHHPEVQLVVRVHPGERYTQGPSVASVLQAALSQLPEHIHLVPFDAAINTYDLIQIADLGLVYTTTTGMEMAMSGLPVIVSGQTHYRGRGFTLDPDSWETYFQTLEGVLENPARARLSQKQVERAWNYAYRFFFEFPMPFPWHVLHMPEDVERWSLHRILSDEGQALYADTFRYLAGAARPWAAISESVNPAGRGSL